jgi:glycosyltransferase involved in cell wall biosynthesis
VNSHDTPVILPVAAEANPRPFWSVMIPTYNAPSNYLEETLRSVLAQDPGPEQMQIEIVDDCSPNGPPVELVRRIAGDRVAIHREPKNNGLAGTWNRCIERACGEWVHILHQDDYVLPGFYASMRRGIQDGPQLGAAFCRHAFVDPENRRVGLSPLERQEPGELDKFIELLASSCVLQCPSIVVKRGVYENLGGFSQTLKYTLDWDMWLRLAVKYPVWYDTGILACYRTHGGSETGRLVQSGQNLREIRHMLETAASLNGRPNAKKILSQARTTNALKAIRVAEMFLYRSSSRPNRNFSGAWNQLAGAVRLKLNLFVMLAIAGVGLRLVGSIIRSPARRN